MIGVSEQVVLADGKVVNATREDHGDLFWALKGGGNSFGIVTNFDLTTYSAPKICAGVKTSDASTRDKFLEALGNFGQHGSSDPKAAVIPTAYFIAAGKSTIYITMIFYDNSEAKCDQPALTDFTALPAFANTYGPTTLATYAGSTDILMNDNARQVFRVLSSLASPEALHIAHDTYIESAKRELGDVDGLRGGLTFQPITKNFIQQGIEKGGNPQGLDAEKAPYFCKSTNQTSLSKHKNEKGEEEEEEDMLTNR